MRFEEAQPPFSDDSAAVISSGSVLFDPERLRLEGRYADELSAYRARKHWIDLFEASFLLDHEHDFQVRVFPEVDLAVFSTRCEFLSACGRYAFWRLTHHQAPEVQSMVETAHLPSFTQRYVEPGMESPGDYECLLMPQPPQGLLARLGQWVSRFLRS